MRSINFERIFEIYVSAKRVGDLDLANCLFAFTAFTLYHFRQVAYSADDYVRLRVGLTTDDPHGISEDEVYYDLITISLRNHRMVIPAPMVNFYMAVSMLKQAMWSKNVVERTLPSDEGSYEEKVAETTKVPVSLLWEEADKLTGGRMVEMAHKVILDEDRLTSIKVAADKYLDVAS